MHNTFGNLPHYSQRPLPRQRRQPQPRLIALNIILIALTVLAVLAATR